MSKTYVNPLAKRYASNEMSYIFSEEYKFKTWRRLWIALAEEERELGLDISEEQIEDLKKYKDDINYEVAEEREKLVRHDVMSHVYAYGVQAKKASPIIHLGATSCYVGDNTELIQIREALYLIKARLVKVMRNLKDFSLKYKDLPTLAFTHFQPAQLTTVGKRGTLWLQDLVIDYWEIDHVIKSLRFRGVKGTTGTQASFMKLFDNDEERVKKLDELVSSKFNFIPLTITGQTYPRKYDSLVLNCLSLIAQSAYKFSNDLRLLQALKEIEEPFEKDQIGSSAMAYKRNPMRCERISALSRYIIINSLNPAITASTQWFERTLDDSANKRLSIAEGFLALDGVLKLYDNVTANLVVYEKVIEGRINSELPFMATENIMMEAVKRGANRQEIHEIIRKHSMDVAYRIKMEGLENDLIERIAHDKGINLTKEEINSAINPLNFIGRAPSQVMEFIEGEVNPILEVNKEELDLDNTISL